MKKLLVTLLVSLLTVLVLGACGAGSGQETESPAEEETAAEETVEEEIAQQTSGGWEVDPEAEAVKLPEEVETAFHNATELLTGTEFTPIAYFSKQVVAGTNYQVLCRSALTTMDSSPGLQVVVIYQDLEGNAEVLNIADFDIGEYTGQDEDEDVDGPLSGGWEVPEDYTTSELPEKVKAAYEAGIGQENAEALTPMAYLGSQVVAGTNYAVLVHSGSGGGSIQVATIYEDLDGKAELTNLCAVDPADFNEQEDDDGE